jgi:hypothetical protein
MKMIPAGHGLKMLGINAALVLALMMDISAIGNLPDKHGVTSPVRPNEATAKVKVAVASPVFGSDPFPTASSGWSPLLVKAFKISFNHGLRVGDCGPLRKDFRCLGLLPRNNADMVDAV